MHQRSYQKGDFVFATCPNYKPWPAIIIKVQTAIIFEVKFFNHKSTAYIDSCDLMDFNQITVKRFKNMYKDTCDSQESKILKGIQLAWASYQKTNKNIFSKILLQKLSLQEKKESKPLEKRQLSKHQSRQYESKQKFFKKIEKKQSIEKNLEKKTNQKGLVKSIPTILQTKKILQKIKRQYIPKQNISVIQAVASPKQMCFLSNIQKSKQIKMSPSDITQINLSKSQIKTQKKSQTIFNEATIINYKSDRTSKQTSKKKKWKKPELSLTNKITQQVKRQYEQPLILAKSEQQILEPFEIGPRMPIYSKNSSYINLRYNYDHCNFDSNSDSIDIKQGRQFTLLKGVLMQKVLLQNKHTSFVCDLLRNYLYILQEHLTGKNPLSQSQCLLAIQQKQILMAILQCNHISLECLVEQKLLKPMVNFVLTYEKIKGRHKRFCRVEYILIRSRVNISSHLFQNDNEDYSLIGEYEEDEEDYFRIFQEYDSRTVK